MTEKQWCKSTVPESQKGGRCLNAGAGFMNAGVLMTNAKKMQGSIWEKGGG